jgi:serine protease inhibitor ecotin
VERRRQSTGNFTVEENVMTAHRACVLLVAVAALTPNSLPAAAASPDPAFMRQSVLQLPSQPNEAELTVELIPGQTVCRAAWVITPAVIQQQAGDRSMYVATWDGAPPASCAADEHLADAVPGKSLQLTYDSRRPLVLAAPEMLEISYRIIGPDGASQPKTLSMLDAGSVLAASAGFEVLTSSSTQVAALEDQGTRSDWIRGPGEAIPAIPPELLQTAMLPEAPQKLPVQQEAHLINKDRKSDGVAVEKVRRPSVTVEAEVAVSKRAARRIKSAQRKVRAQREPEMSELRRELKRRMGKSYDMRLGRAFGGRMSVFSLQTRGTKVTRRHDRHGNRVLIIQSD